MEPGILVHSQVVQHVSHVPSVVQSVPVRVLRLRHLALVLQHVSQVSPGCRGCQSKVRYLEVKQNFSTNFKA